MLSINTQHQKEIPEMWFKPGPSRLRAWSLLLCYDVPPPII